MRSSPNHSSDMCTAYEFRLSHIHRCIRFGNLLLVAAVVLPSDALAGC